MYSVVKNLTLSFIVFAIFDAVFNAYNLRDLVSGKVLTPAFYSEAYLRITRTSNGDTYVNNALILRNLSFSFGRQELNGKV